MNIFFNGKNLSLTRIEPEVFGPGLLNGYGVFETMRSYNGNIVYLNEHLERFYESARLLGLNITYSKKYLESAVLRVVALNKFSDVYVKLLAFLGQGKTNIAIISKRYSPFSKNKYKHGFKVKVSPYRWTPDPRLGMIKSLSRMLLEFAYKQAKKEGFDEAVLLNNKGNVVEGTRTNIFLVKDKKIITPSLECGCLAGITRNVVFDLALKNGIKITQKKVGLKDLLSAEEVFLTNSLIGIMPARVYKIKSSGEQTSFLIQEYDKILKKENPWLKE